MKHVIVWTRIGATVLVAIAVLGVAQKIDSESKGRALPDPSMSRTSLRGTTGVGSAAGVEVSGAGNADSIAPNVAQSEELDAAGALEMDKTFANEVQRRLKVPTADQLLYGSKLQQALQEKSLGAIANEYVVLVDRNQNVQALFIYFRARADGIWHMVGATPVSTGPSRYLRSFHHTDGCFRAYAAQHGLPLGRDTERVQDPWLWRSRHAHL